MFVLMWLFSAMRFWSSLNSTSRRCSIVSGSWPQNFHLSSVARYLLNLSVRSSEFSALSRWIILAASAV